MDKKITKTRNLKVEVEVCLTDYPGNFKNLAKMKKK